MGRGSMGEERGSSAADGFACREERRRIQRRIWSKLSKAIRAVTSYGHLRRAWHLLGSVLTAANLVSAE